MNDFSNMIYDQKKIIEHLCIKNCRLFFNHVDSAEVPILFRISQNEKKKGKKIDMNKNKILTAVMAGSMLMGSTLPVFAATTESQGVNQAEAEAGATRDTEVLYDQASTFSVTIPKTIVLGDTKASDYTVNVKGDIASDKQVNVTPNASFDMIDQAGGKDDVEATVTQNETVWSSKDVCKENGTDKAGNVEALGLTAGSWKGTFQFTIVLENAE